MQEEISAKKYVVTERECRESIHGVCEGCGGGLEPIKTVDNAENLTFWVGCRHCNCFRSGVDIITFAIARQLVEEGKTMSPLNKIDYEKTPKQLDYYLCTQTASAAGLVDHILFLSDKFKNDPPFAGNGNAKQKELSQIIIDAVVDSGCDYTNKSLDDAIAIAKRELEKPHDKC